MEGHAQIMFSVEFIPGAMEWEGGRLDGKNQESGRTHLDFLSGAEVERAGRMGAERCTGKPILQNSLLDTHSYWTC